MLFIKNKIYTVSNNRNERIIKVFFFETLIMFIFTIYHSMGFLNALNEYELYFKEIIIFLSQTIKNNDVCS